MQVYLKVKICSLAAEARIIRSLEKRRRGPKYGPGAERAGLWMHRTKGIRYEARCSQLAYGFLRGRAYRQMERSCHKSPDWERVKNIAERFSAEDKRVIAQRFAEWRDAGQTPPEPPALIAFIPITEQEARVSRGEAA